MCVYITFSSVWVADWPPFGKELLTRLTICSLCILTICNVPPFFRVKLMCVYTTLSSVWVADRPPFGKELFTRLTICSLCIMTICNFTVLVLTTGFWVLNASFPGLCIAYFLLLKN